MAAQLDGPISILTGYCRSDTAAARRICREHEEIADALSAGGPEEAGRLLRIHLNHSLEDIRSHMNSAQKQD